MQGFNKIEVYFSLTHWLEGSESKLKTTTEETGRQNKDSDLPYRYPVLATARDCSHGTLSYRQRPKIHVVPVFVVTHLEKLRNLLKYEKKQIGR